MILTTADVFVACHHATLTCQVTNITPEYLSQLACYV